jgi:hypothetical protein
MELFEALSDQEDPERAQEESAQVLDASKNGFGARL